MLWGGYKACTVAIGDGEIPLLDNRENKLKKTSIYGMQKGLSTFLASNQGWHAKWTYTYISPFGMPHITNFPKMLTRQKGL